MKKFIVWFGSANTSVYVNVVIATYYLVMTVVDNWFHISGAVGFTVASGWALLCWRAETKLKKAETQLKDANEFTSEIEAFLKVLSNPPKGQ